MSWQRGWGEATPGSDARPVSRGRMVTLSQGELHDLEQGGQSKANRAFTYAAVIFTVAGLALGFGAGRAFGGDTAEWGGTGCQLVPVSGQAHVAEVRCRNVETSGSPMTEGDMVAGDLAAHVAILHGPGDVPDHFTITPQPGFIADPQLLILDEWTSGTVRIYPFVGA